MDIGKKQEVEAKKKKNAENRKLIYSRAKQYAKEYEEQQKELIQLKHEAKLKGGFYVDPEYQCYALEDDKDFAALAFETG